MTVIRVGEIELDYERSGAGPPLLMIMGMSGTALSWGEPFLEDLREDFEVIVYDHRGVGASTPLDGPITIREMAEDAAGLLEALEIDSAHVLGISMGGMIAQELALAHPERMHTLTLGCTYCGGEGSAHIDEQAVRPLIEARMAGDRERALRAAWEINVSPGYAADADAWARFAAIADASPRRRARDRRAGARDRRARHQRAPRRDRAADARHPRHRGPAAAGGQRPHDRLADPRLAA